MFEWYEIIYLVIGVLGLLFGGAFWRKFDTALKLLKELSDLLEEVSDLFDNVAEALKDRKITKSEAVLLLKEWQEVSASFKNVYDVLMILLPSSAIKFLFRR